MINDADFHRIARWASGDLSPTEADETKLWIDDDPERIRLADDLARIAEAGSQWDSSVAVARWRADIRSTQRPYVLPSRCSARTARTIRRVLTPQRPSVRPSLLAAAVVSLAVGLQSLGNTRSSAATDAVEVAPPPAVYSTFVGERMTVALSDGTQVLLAPNTRLRVPAFRDHRRQVYLEGEAVFHVVHDAARPFTVFTAASAVRDLGTVFGVRAYHDESWFRVAVEEGIVALGGVGHLQAGSVARVAANGTVTMSRHADVRRLTGWTRGEFSYDKTPLREVLADLNRWRDARVQVADSALGEIRFTGLLTGMSTPKTIAYVAAATGLEVVPGQELTTLRKRPSNPTRS